MLLQVIMKERFVLDVSLSSRGHLKAMNSQQVFPRSQRNKNIGTAWSKKCVFCDCFRAFTFLFLVGLRSVLKLLPVMLRAQVLRYFCCSIKERDAFWKDRQPDKVAFVLPDLSNYGKLASCKVDP